MTVEDVAREVGIGKGTIYLHFSGKEELVLAHVDRIAARVLVRLKEIVETSEPAPRRLRDMLVARVMVRFDSVVHYSQSLSDLLSSVRSALLVRRASHFEAEAQLLERAIVEGAAAGELERSDSPATSQVLIVATSSLLPFNLSTRELGRRELVLDQATRIADVLIRGLRR